jgi:hypothetical protein
MAMQFAEYHAGMEKGPRLPMAVKGHLNSMAIHTAAMHLVKLKCLHGNILSQSATHLLQSIETIRLCDPYS